MSFTKHSTTEAIVKRLREAAKAYYETDKPVMSDAEYDSLVDDMKRIDPDHPFFHEVGYKPSASVVKLPVPMASLDKRKPDTLRADDVAKGPYVVSDKLDGISALWICGYSQKPRLLLRGDGLEGQDVSHCIKGIQGLRECAGNEIMVRGELIAPKGVIQGTLARNWVNGILHQKSPDANELKKVRFVAYQLCKPNIYKRSEQMDWLVRNNFEIAHTVKYDKITVDTLTRHFQERRESSPYECDGIVVGQDTIPALGTAATNPKDAYAFKMPTDDQRAQTIVKEVEWASSRTNCWIPRVRFEPVRIGTATIEYCTGFHGQFIEQNSIGPGAEVVIRRSGDVIPVLERVIKASPSGWQKPPEGRWEWDDSHVHCRDTTQEASPEKLALEMAHQLVCLGVEGISKTTAKKLVEGGILTLYDLWKASTGTVQERIGKVNGEKLKGALEPAMLGAKSSQWIKAFLGWPKGFGDVRIEATLALEPNVEAWSRMTSVPKGQSATAFEEVKKAVPGYLEWRKQFPSGSVQAVVIATKPTVVKGYYVLSGFRDAELQEKLAAAGWILQERVAKTTNVLLVPDDAKETTKVKAAREAGVQIVQRSKANPELLSVV